LDTRLLERGAFLRFVGFVKEAGEVSKLCILPKYCEALKGLDSFSHIIVLYWLHGNDSEDNRQILRVTPRRHAGAPELGVFATRSPIRPNPIAFEVCKLIKVDGCTVFVEGSDAYEGTPIVDIKPYIPRADAVTEAITPAWTSFGPKT
jgi:tRNA-Thr(GGU) m(6)t(6)A37 methyltransferase TsaA